MPDMSVSASAGQLVSGLVPLAAEVDKNKVTPGVLGFIVFAVMALAVWGLRGHPPSPDRRRALDGAGAELRRLLRHPLPVR
ncbi:hypothetical protein ACWD6I_19205, partial [Streptomyces sp. NPDC002454]